ncbi:MAG: YceI family protein [Chloroflexi bacterium]|nr:YceI family protein [Chloroflexota bacterium]
MRTLIPILIAVLLAACGGPTSVELDPTPEITAENTFAIQQDRSEARFIIDEVLRGDPTTVVGATDDVTGTLVVDYADPAAASIGLIRINATTLATDIDLRNRALQGQILQTGEPENQVITFEPTAVEGLPAEPVTLGESIPLTITGMLTVHGETNEVTFEGSATPTDGSTIEGTFSTTIQYADYGISIPDVPQVAEVSDDVTLEIDFVATTP